MKPIKIAILSCNHGHAKAYYGTAFNTKYQLVGVSVEPGYEGRVLLEKIIPNIPQYNSDEELYRNHPDIEAVVVGSANIRHAEQTVDAARRGLHIFSMKVPTFDMAEYDRMIEATEKAGIVCQVELEMREHPEIYRVKELIKAGEIGEVLSVTAINFSHNPVSWRPWQANPEQSYGRRVPLGPEYDKFRGGALADHPHIFDMVRYVLDTDFESVYAQVAPNLRDTETEDLIYVIGRLTNGASFSLDPSYASTENKVALMDNWERHPKPVDVTMTVHGTKGSIIADVYGQYAYHNGLPDGRYLVQYLGYKGSQNKQMDEFYNCIRHGVKPTITLRGHRRVIEVMNAAYGSLQSGKPVRV